MTDTSTTLTAPVTGQNGTGTDNQNGNQGTGAQNTEPPLELSVEKDLPAILGLLVGDSSVGGATGLTLESESTPVMIQHRARLKAMAKQKKSQAKALKQFKAGTFPGQKEFAKALQQYADRDKRNREREDLVHSSLAAAKRATTTEEKDKYLNLAVGASNEMGRYDDAARTLFRAAAQKLAEGLRAHGAGQEAMRVLQLSEETSPVRLGSAATATAELTSSLEKTLSKTSDAVIETRNNLEAETRYSDSRRKKIAASTEVLKRLSSQKEVDAALSTYKRRLAAEKRYRRELDSYRDIYGHRHDSSNRGFLPSKLGDARRAWKAWRRVKDYKEFADALASAKHPTTQITDALDTVVKYLPTDSPRRTAFEGLVSSVKLRAIDVEYQKIRKRLKAKAESLSPGSSDEVTGDLEVGASFGLGSAMKLETTVIVGVKQKIERVRTKADGTLAWKASFAHNENLSVNFKAGDVMPAKEKQALKANVQAGMETEHVRTYDTLEELLTNETERSMKLLFLGSEIDSKKAEKSAAGFLHEREKLIVTAHQNSQALEKMLAMSSKRRLKLKNPIPEFGRTAQITSHSRSGALGAGGAMGFSAKDGHSALLSGGVGVKHKRKLDQSFLSISYLTEIMDDQKRQELHRRAHQQRFAYYTTNGDVMTDVDYGADAVAKIKVLEDRIRSARLVLEADGTSTDDRAEALDVLAAARLETWNNLQGLAFEYRRYLDLENAIVKKRISKSKDTLATRDHALSARGLKPGDQAGLIKALSVQYAVVKKLYESSHGYGFEQLPDQKDALSALEADLQTPKIGLTARQIQKRFGTDAVGKKARINTTTINVAVAGGWKKGGSGLLDFGDGADTISDGSEDAKDKKKAKATGLAGVALTAEIGFEEKWAEGSSEPDKKLGIEFSVSHSGAGILTQPSVVAIVGKLFGTTDILKKSSPTELEGLKQHCVESIMKLGVNAMTRGPVRLDLVQPTGKPTRWVLKETLAFEATERKTGVRTDVKLGGPVGLITGFNVASRSRRLIRVRRAHTTLAGIGETFRTYNATGNTNEASWQRFKQQTGLLERFVDQLDREVAVGAGGALDGKRRATFADYLNEIKKGSKIRKNQLILTPTGKKSRAALSSDVLEMLVDLKGGEEAEVAAADAFIDAWHKRTAAKTASEADRKKLTAALAGAFDEVIAQKSAKELRTVKDDYQKPTGFTTEEINDLVVDDLVAKVRKLRVDSGIDEMKLPDLRQKVIKAYTDGVKDDSDGAKKRLKALKTMMAIDYAAKTLEDLTAYKNEADKETAIGHLGSNLDEIVDTDQKIYVNPMIDGELVESDGKLQLRLVVKKGFESAVTAAGLYAAYTETTKELTALDLPVSGSFKVDDVTFDDGDEKKKWRSKMHNKKAENDAIQKLADIRFPASAKTNRKLRFSKGKKSIAQKHKASLLSALAVVLEQQEKAKARNRQQGRVGAAR